MLIAISKIMKGVINDEKKIDMISKFYNLDAQMLLSEANIFTALHAMQTRSSDENSASPSVNACMLTKRKKDLSRFLYHTKDHLAYFSEKKNGLVGGRPILSEILGQPTRLERNRRFSTDIRL